jgi:O-antigen/teichoic acid export membrane protein
MEALKSVHRHALGRNYLLSLGGESLQSGFHFILNLVLIWALTPYEYGIFAIVLILGGISLTYGNALVSVPAAVHIPKLRSPGSINFQDVVFSSFAVAISTALAAIVTAGLWLTIGHLAEAVSGGALVGLWTMRNHIRVTLFARRAMVLTTLSDIGYSASGVTMIATLFWLQSGAPQVTAVLTVLAGANVIAIVIALTSLGVPIRISFRRSVRDRYRAICLDIVWSLVGVTTWSIQGQAPMFVVAAFVGPAAYAPIAAGIVLFNPTRTALGAFINVVRPEFAAGLAHSLHRQVKLTLYSSSAVIILCCLAFGAAIWLSWDMLNAHIYGNKFSTASMPLIVTLAGLSALIYLSYHVPLSLVQAARGFKTVAIATTLGGMVGLTAVVILLLYSTVSWSLAGFAAGEAVCWTYLWIGALRVLGNIPASPQAASTSEHIDPVTIHSVLPARGVHL